MVISKSPWKDVDTQPSALRDKDRWGSVWIELLIWQDHFTSDKPIPTRSAGAKIIRAWHWQVCKVKLHLINRMLLLCQWLSAAGSILFRGRLPLPPNICWFSACLGALIQSKPQGDENSATAARFVITYFRLPRKCIFIKQQPRVRYNYRHWYVG